MVLEKGWKKWQKDNAQCQFVREKGCKDFIRETDNVISRKGLKKETISFVKKVGEKDFPTTCLGCNPITLPTFAIAKMYSIAHNTI